MKVEWKDFLEKSAQLFPGQGVGRNGNITLPGAKVEPQRPKYDIRTDPKFSRAYSFYRDIAPAIRMKELGVDKLPEEERRAFDELQYIPVVQNAERDDGPSNAAAWYDKAAPRLERTDWLDDINWIGHLLGHYDPSGEKVSLTSGATAINLVHELRHALAKRVSLGNHGHLNNIYGFLGNNIKPELGNKGMEYSNKFGLEELFTTNKEHQFRIYEDLYDKLGRPPTAEEYFKATEDNGYILRSFNSPVNGYEQSVNRSNENPNGIFTAPVLFEKIDLIRKAMQSISKNRRGAVRNGWSMFIPKTHNV